MIRMSGRMALSVIAVSISVSPFFTEEATDMFITSAPSRLPASLERGLRAGRGLEEQVDLGAAAQDAARSGFRRAGAQGVDQIGRFVMTAEAQDLARLANTRRQS
jgi:hypothetical protein